MSNFTRLHRRLQEKANDYDARAVTYVAIGDSVTQGCMEDGVHEHERIYHRLLADRLLKRYPTSVINVINSGVAGDKAERSRTRWDRDVFPYNPDLVTICFGLNDAHGGAAGIADYIGAIRDLASRLRRETESDILLLTPGMMMSRDNERICEKHRPLVPSFLQVHEQGYLEQYVQALKQLARDEGLACLDLYRLWEAKVQAGVDIHTLLVNGINHPVTSMHEEMAAAMEAHLFSSL